MIFCRTSLWETAAFTVGTSCCLIFSSTGSIQQFLNSPRAFTRRKFLAAVCVNAFALAGSNTNVGLALLSIATYRFFFEWYRTYSFSNTASPTFFFLLWRRSRDSNPDRRRVSPAQGLEPCVLTVTPLLYVLLSVGIEPTSPCSALSYESRSPADGAGNPFMKLLTSGQRRAPRGLETLVGSSSNLNYFCPARRTWSPIRGLNSELIG